MDSPGNATFALERTDSADMERRIIDVIAKSDAFVLTGLPDVLGTEELGDRVWKQVSWAVSRWGKRLLVLGAVQQLNPWLETFDMQVSSHKLFPLGWESRPGRTGILQASVVELHLLSDGLP